MPRRKIFSSLKFIFLTLGAVNILAIGMLAVIWKLYQGATVDLKAVADQRYISYVLADELRQSSDDLTRLARTYAVTGDARYEDQYMQILDIRNGKKPRPIDAHRIYWDFVAADDKKPRPDGITKPLLTLMKEAGFTEAEFGKLEIAKANSDNLVNLEVKAMNAVKGLFPDAAGTYTTRGEPDLKLARELMHSRDYHRFKADIMRPIDEFFVLLDQRTQGAIDQARSWLDTLGLISNFLMAVAVAVMALSGWLLFIRIMRPLGRVAGVMTDMAHGRDDAVVEGAERGDEIGDMVRAVDVFRGNAMDVKRLRSEQAEAAARAAEVHAAEMNKLADSFETVVGSVVSAVTATSSQLETAATSLTSTAATTQNMAGTVAQASDRASAHVQSAASAAEEMAASVNEIGRQVQESSRIASEAVAQAEQTDVRIGELSQAAARIGDVVKLITAIAEQTNLLALNATIEAARAGDAGRGFAVVAQEVKALASQTAKATDEIATQIAAMQAATQESVGAIKEIGGTIGRISQIASGIATAVEKQGAATGEIARNVQEAARGTAQMVTNIGDVTRGATETGSASTNVLTSARSLSKESNELKSAVQKFLATVRAA
ncbi:MAG TPA: methyl-accepting chemotaxis protein [Xanthobacteraceae bacterium]|jgi:methyl-accepting chemotaxis protein|nr:methyl-accepting chemotaxis protein [Xanthobacteraceae bacterium]